MRVLAILACILMLPGFLTAQTTTGSITGSVVDPSGAAIINATVTLTSLGRGTVSTTTTDDSGRFVFSTVDPGNYNLVVKASGFKLYEQKALNLVARDRLNLPPAALVLGSIDQTVEVTAEALLLKTESAERSDAIVGRQLQNVMVNGRSYLALTALVPGVINTNDYKTPGHAGLANIYANGARGNQNQLTLNGISNVDTGNNGDQLATISLDAVQEFKMLTGTYQAEYGRSSGAQIVVLTKSGANSFHGSGYWFHRHEGMNANTWMNNRNKLPRQLFRSNVEGYTIGGPVYIPGKFNSNKDKLFFFWSQEFQGLLRPQNARNLRVPTAAERTGDFSQTLDNNGNLYPYIRDYTLNAPCSSTNTAGCFRDGGVLGKIPQSRLFQPGLNILNIYPTPNFNQPGFNYTSQISDSYPRREDLIRIDYNATNNLRIFGHYINNSDSITSNYGSFVLGFNLPIVPITDARPGRSMALGGTWIISPTMTNEATFGYGHNQINIDPINDGLTRASLKLSALPILYPGAVQNDFAPSFVFGGRMGTTPTGGTNNAPFFNYNTTYDYIDNLTKVQGAHVLKFGIFLQKSMKDQTSFANANGAYVFTDNPSNPFDSQTGFSNAALGVYNTFTQASVYATGKYRYWNYEWFAQDTWKVTSRLTLDFGLRMALYQPQYDKLEQTSTWYTEDFSATKASVLFRPIKAPDGSNAALNPVTGETVPFYLAGKIVPSTLNLNNGICPAGTCTSRYLMDYRGIQWGPRVGIAWDMTGKQNLVFRAGGGIFYDRFQGNETFDMLTNPPTTIQPTLQYGLMKDIDPKGQVFVGPPGLNAFSPDGSIPTVYNYQAGVQARLPGQFVLDAAYVGSLSRHLLQRINQNPIAYGATFAAGNQDPTKSSSQLGSAAYSADFLRPYQGFANINQHMMGSSTNFNSLQVGVNRRFNTGLFFQLSYTWSKALGVASADGDFIRIDSYTRYANYGPLSFDRRQNFAANFVYDIPSFAKNAGWNAVMRGLIDGWQLSGIYKLQTGAPGGVGYGINGAGNENISGSYTEGSRVLLYGNPQTSSEDPYARLDPLVIKAPYVGSRGLDTPRIMFYGPGVNNFDISIQKQFTVKERLGFQFRVDAFNALNHTQFSGYNSTITYNSLTNLTPANLVYKADGTLNNINGFGSVSGVRDARFIQILIRMNF